MASLADFIQNVKDKIQDDADTLKTSDISSYVLNALTQFSKDKPRILVSDITGDGGFDYDLPATWQDGFSSIKSVEFPANERIPAFLERGDYRIYENASEKKLRFMFENPASTQIIRFSYTVVYLNSTMNSIPAPLENAFSNLAASETCLGISRKFGFSSDPTIDADSVDHENKSAVFAKRAKELKRLYDVSIGKRKDNSGASVNSDWDVRYTWGNDLLIHSERCR